MKLSELAAEVAQTRNPRLASRLADVLRFKCGMNYVESQQWMESKTGMDAEQWEELMYSADMCPD